MKPIKLSEDKELAAVLLEQLGIRKPRRSQMTIDEVRQNSIKVLNTIVCLSKAQRTRVLKHALKVNEV